MPRSSVGCRRARCVRWERRARGDRVSRLAVTAVQVRVEEPSASDDRTRLVVFCARLVRWWKAGKWKVDKVRYEIRMMVQFVFWDATASQSAFAFWVVTRQCLVRSGQLSERYLSHHRSRFARHRAAPGGLTPARAPRIEHDHHHGVIHRAVRGVVDSDVRAFRRRREPRHPSRRRLPWTPRQPWFTLDFYGHPARRLDARASHCGLRSPFDAADDEEEGVVLRGGRRQRLFHRHSRVQGAAAHVQRRGGGGAYGASRAA